MANVLAGLGQRVEQVPAEAIVAVVPVAVRRAEVAGGDFGGAKLTAQATRYKVTKTGASVTLRARPGAQWAWLERGIESHDIKPEKRRAL